jgi:AbrB family looped-hinge helix DNA binding protein
MAQATISSKNKIVIPREAREALDLKAGDKVLVVRGKRVLCRRQPPS